MRALATGVAVAAAADGAAELAAADDAGTADDATDAGAAEEAAEEAAEVAGAAPDELVVVDALPFEQAATTVLAAAMADRRRNWERLRPSFVLTIKLLILALGHSLKG